jgi:hypothetical protein
MSESLLKILVAVTTRYRDQLLLYILLENGLRYGAGTNAIRWGSSSYTWNTRFGTWNTFVSEYYLEILEYTANFTYVASSVTNLSSETM